MEEVGILDKMIEEEYNIYPQKLLIQKVKEYS